MKNNDVVRVSELGGWSRGDATVDKPIRADKSTQNKASSSIPFLQDSAYESKVGLKEYLESLSRYKWHAFFFTVLVFVVGLLVWLQTYQVSFSANSSLLKKNFNPRYSLTYSPGISETWSRTIKGDVTYMRSDYVYNAARKITQCIANMTLEERKKYLNILETEAIGEMEAIGETKVDPADVPSKDLSMYGDDFTEIDRHWFALDWENAKRIPFDEAINNSSGNKPKDSLIVAGKQMRTLILNFWGEDVDKENPKTALNVNILNYQNAVLSKLSISSDEESGLITTTVSDMNENVAVFISNLFPTAFVSANNRIVVTKNHRELAIIEKLAQEAKESLAAAKDALTKANEKYKNEIRDKIDPEISDKRPVARDSEIADVLGMIADRKKEQMTLEAENNFLTGRAGNLELRLRILLNPYTDEIASWKHERTIKSFDMKPTSPEIKRINGIIANLEKQSDDWNKTNENKSIEEITNPDSMSYTTYYMYSELMDAGSEIEKNKKKIEILGEEITALEAQYGIVADKSTLSEVDKAQIEYDLTKDENREVIKVLKNLGFKTSSIPEMYQWNKTATKDKIKTRDTKYILIFIGFVSLLIGLIFARIADVLDTRIKTDLQVKEISPYPILAHIPMLSSSERYITPDSKGTTMHRLAANLFGILGVNLRLGGQKQPDRTIAVTSSLPREGKSFVAFNLAAYYAIEGFKTCLLVADLRNPTLEPFPEIALTAKPGFLDYLEAKESDNPMPIEETVMRTYIDNLHIIGPGTKKNINPTRLFDQDYFNAYLSELLEYFDTVIIDSPPLMPVVDSSLILKCVKSAVMVLNLGRVKKKDFEDTVRRLQLIDAPINGLVINRDQYAVRRKYYAYYSSGYISGI